MVVARIFQHVPQWQAATSSVKDRTGSTQAAAPIVSVVIPLFNRAHEVVACLSSLQAQSLAATEREIIVVDDGSTDCGADIAEGFCGRVVRQPNRGAPAARNAGIRAARGRWIAFTDSDCVASRNWLRHLLGAVQAGAGGAAAMIGAAGRTVGHGSDSAAARFVDLTGGLDAERHLAHPRWPFAPTANVLYRRDALIAAGGFDERFCAYDACDLHARIDPPAGSFAYAPHAIVLHRHRDTWAAYARQQRGYGRGLAQFMLLYREEVRWSAWREALAWGRLAARGLIALADRANTIDDRLVRKGTFIKELAQRQGFAATYWNAAERRRWRRAIAAGTLAADHG